MSRRLPAFPALLLPAALALSPSLQAEEAGATVSAAGGLAWISDPALEGEGFMQAGLVAPLTRTFSAESGFEARTSIRGADGLTFDVRDVRYQGRLALQRDFGTTLSLLAVGEVWGREAVDAQGSAQTGLVGLGLRTSVGGWEGTIEAGSVVDAREVDAEAWARLRTRWRHARAGLDLDFRLLDGEVRRSDLTVGPSLEIPWSGLHVRLFAAYLRHRTPLGLGLDGFQVGLAFEDGAPERITDPLQGDVFGRIGVGLGDARRAGRLQIVATTPPWRAGWRLAADVDGQVLTAEDPGDLFYLYTVGLERAGAGDPWLLGAWFYHRSNHRLAEPGSFVTSWNVIEAGLETLGWNRAVGRGSEARWGRVDGRVRLGWLLDSSFGEERRWHVRAGARWSAPARGGVVPFLEGQAEEGDVSIRQAAAGTGFPSGLELSIRWLHDPQLFASDATALLGMATLRF